MISSRWLAGLLFLAAPLLRADSAPYFPPRGEWARRTPEEMGVDSAKLDEAIAFSIAHQNSHTKDLAVDMMQTTGKSEKGFRIHGPTKPRGGMTGVVIRHGYVIATWGDPDRVDMTFSATKTFLTTTVGVAWQKHLIRNLNDRVVDYMPTNEYFATEHNAKITWDNMLRQTSNWIGTLWGTPDSAGLPPEYCGQPLYEPGTFFCYNDVRMNMLALAALNVLRRPLPQVLREEVMDPIGASNRWRWCGYDDSWVEIDGQKMQSVTGGGHYGGGMFIDAWDMARFGYLFLRDGNWNGRQIVSREWIRMARTPGKANPGYGFANWYPNTGLVPKVSFGGAAWPMPSCPHSAILFHGHGANIIYMDAENDLLVVVRWLNDPAGDGFFGRVEAAIRGGKKS